MMIGELEFEDIFHGEENGVTKNPILHPITTHGMFFTFVVLVTVILMNLLVGLAVSDIQGLQASAGLNRLSRQAELVARLEGLLFSRILTKAPTKVIKFFRREALLRTSRYNLQLTIKPNDPREKSIPKDIMASIYRLVAERRDKNQSIRRKRNTRNLNLFKESVEEIQLRRPPLSRTQTMMRQRTVSDQPFQRDSQRDSATLNHFPPNSTSIRKQSNDIVMLNIKNQLKDVEAKVDVMSKRLEEIYEALKK
jgi:hypothetical protein